MFNGKMFGGVESENMVTEEGQSSESVTNVYNSTGPPQDYESSDTSLKLGLVHFNLHTFNTISFNVSLHIMLFF